MFDAAKRKINFDEATSRWRGRVSRWYFHMADGQAPSSLLFLGTEAPETVFVSGLGLVPHFRLGGGDDWGGSLTTKGGTFFLGDGRDRLTLGKFDSVAATFPFADARREAAPAPGCLRRRYREPGPRGRDPEGQRAYSWKSWAPPARIASPRADARCWSVAVRGPMS